MTKDESNKNRMVFYLYFHSIIGFLMKEKLSVLNPFCVLAAAKFTILLHRTVKKVSDIPAGDGKIAHLFLQCPQLICDIFYQYCPRSWFFLSKFL
jgi:hypothetical protein